jgi:hypothetical protein
MKTTVYPHGKVSWIQFSSEDDDVSEVKPKWSELGKDNRDIAIRHIKEAAEEKRQAGSPRLAELLDAAAEELASPTWEGSEEDGKS